MGSRDAGKDAATTHGDAHEDGDERLENRELWRRLLAEAVGTLLLTFVAAGAEVVAKVAPGQVAPATKAVAPALVILAMIYAVSDVSGAHFSLVAVGLVGLMKGPSDLQERRAAKGEPQAR